MRNITLLDGSAGTALWNMADEAGVAKEPVWKFNLEHPEFVAELHRRYIAAGSRMIQSNTFDANRFSVASSSSYTPAEVITAAVGIARTAVAGTDVKVSASFGPVSKLMEPYGPLKREEIIDIYAEMCGAAAQAGADIIALETFMDVSMMAAALTAAKQFSLPVICSMTFFRRHRTMMGDTVEQIVNTLAPLGADILGTNCSVAPTEAVEILKEFRTYTDLPLYVKPNSGTEDCATPEQFAELMRPALDVADYVGGCCGTDWRHIEALGKLL